VVLVVTLRSPCGHFVVIGENGAGKGGCGAWRGDFGAPVAPGKKLFEIIFPDLPLRKTVLCLTQDRLKPAPALKPGASVGPGRTH